ncbi:hypothetical protein [uncultured Croceitalea sp.]|uniref:hypothetical protein n=1 Tax=uncultured Croceitalea sp. TaxID=1798908 RepID=UPI003305C43E
MKKLLLLFVLMSLIKPCLSQEIKETFSNSELFSTQSGTLIEKEFIDIGNVGKTEIQILKITDMISGESISSLRITRKIRDSYSTDTKIANLDSDEIDGLIKSIKVIKESVFGSVASNYTEITFRSRSGFQAGCYRSKNDWQTYLQMEKNDSKSMVWLKKDEFIQFLKLLENAKSKI